MKPQYLKSKDFFMKREIFTKYCWPPERFFIISFHFLTYTAEIIMKLFNNSDFKFSPNSETNRKKHKNKERGIFELSIHLLTQYIMKHFNLMLSEISPLIHPKLYKYHDKLIHLFI